MYPLGKTSKVITACGSQKLQHLRAVHSFSLKVGCICLLHIEAAAPINVDVSPYYGCNVSFEYIFKKDIYIYI